MRSPSDSYPPVWLRRRESSGSTTSVGGIGMAGASAYAFLSPARSACKSSRSPSRSIVRRTRAAVTVVASRTACGRSFQRASSSIDARS